MTDLVEAKFFCGNRFSDNLIDKNNFTYICWRKPSPDITDWKCSQFREHCKATAQTQFIDGKHYNKRIPEADRHSCTVNLDRMEAKSTLEDVMKNAVANKTVKPRILFGDLTAKLANNNVALTPATSVDTFRKAVYRKRKMEGGVNNIPTTFAELCEQFSEEYTITAAGDTFLIYSGNIEGVPASEMTKEQVVNDSLMLIYMSAVGREILRSKYIWFSDGTFKTCPKPFTQVYTIFGKRKGFPSLPAAYALLPNKEEKTYLQMWKVKLYIFKNYIYKKYSLNPRLFIFILTHFL